MNIYGESFCIIEYYFRYLYFIPNIFFPVSINSNSMGIKCRCGSLVVMVSMPLHEDSVFLLRLPSKIELVRIFDSCSEASTMLTGTLRVSNL